jgi:hypothetical protein
MQVHRILILSIAVSIATPATPQAPSTPPAEDAAATPRTVSAADRPSREQLLTLFGVMRVRPQMEEMLKVLPAALEQQLRSEESEVEIRLMPMGGELTAEQKAARDRVTSKYIQLAEEQYPVNDMIDELVTVYQRNLSREDVDGIIAFYRSTSGQHMLDAQPLMAKEVMPAVSRKFEARDRELIQRYKKDLGDAIGPPKIPPPAAPKS